jgi:hypothetical protein
MTRVAAPDRFDDVLRLTKMERTQSKKKQREPAGGAGSLQPGSSEEPLVTNGGTVARWDNGEIVEENLFYDVVGLMNQIGVGR